MGGSHLDFFSLCGASNKAATYIICFEILKWFPETINDASDLATTLFNTTIKLVISFELKEKILNVKHGMH